MRDIRRSWHCRRLFFRYLRQRDKEKQGANIPMNINSENENNAPKKGLTILTKILLLVGLAFLVAFIVSVCVGKSALNSKPVDWEKSDKAFVCLKTFGGLLVAWIIAFPIIQFVRGYIAGQKAIEKEREKQVFIENLNRQEQNRQTEEALKGKKHLEENVEKLNVLIDKYYQSVYNFVESLHETAYIPFLCVDKSFNNLPPMDTNIIISLFWNSASSLLKTKFKHDGFGYYDYSSSKQFNDNIDKIQKLTEFFVIGLKRRIKEQNEWNDEYTLPIVLYMIIRNNVIKYYHDLYEEEIGYDNIEYYCRHLTNSDIEQHKIVYTYFHIYNTDINLPFVETYNDICLQIEAEQKKQQNEDLENSLFGKGKEPADDDLPEEFRLENLPLKPIEKVDVMTGEEFERYMEKYFIKKGYKVIRTPLSGDYGIDLIIEHEFGKIGVQLKCYFDKVPLKAVQEVVAGLRHYDLSSGMVITNSHFQPSAIRLAKDNNITLWDRETLTEKLEA